MRACRFLFGTVAVLITFVPAFGESGITVTETRLDDGNSTIEVVDSERGVQRTYAINLSAHHHPPTSPDDELVKTFRRWKYGAFLCYNSNQYSGAEFCTSADPRVGH